MMKINTKDFKKVKSEKDHTVFRNKHGHEFKVAHKALSKQMLKDLHALPFADGGKVEDLKKLEEVSEKALSGGLSKELNLPAVNLKGKEAKPMPQASPSPKPMAEGGEVEEDKKKSVGEIIGYPGAPKPKPSPKPQAYAEGGEVSGKRIGDIIGYPGMPPKAMKDGGVAGKDGLDIEEIPPQPLEYEQIGPDSILQPLDIEPIAEAPNASVPTATEAAPPMQSPVEQGFNPASLGTINLGGSTPEIPPSGAGASSPQLMQGASAPQAAAQSAQAPDMPSSQQAPVNDPFGTEEYYKRMGEGIAQTQLGIQGQASAEALRGQQEAASLKKHIEDQQKNVNEYNRHFNDLNRERQSLIEDIQNKHIDPNHFMGSLDTGQRIGTAIGLILGGMGAGLTGGENQALKFLNAQIDRDIGAQRANLGKVENLLSANMRQFGNVRDATDMTRVMQMDMVSSELKKAAAQTTEPLAKARALQVAGELDMKTAPIMSQIAMRRSLLSGMQAGRIPPEQVVRMVVPEGQQKDAYKEISEAQQMIKGKDRVLNAFDKIAELSSLGSRIMSPIQSKRQIEALKGAVIPMLSKETAGRYTESDAKAIDDMFSRMGNSPETNTKLRAEVVKMMNEKMNFPLLRAYGIDMTGMGRYNQVGQATKSFRKD